MRHECYSETSISLPINSLFLSLIKAEVVSGLVPLLSDLDLLKTIKTFIDHDESFKKSKFYGSYGAYTITCITLRRNFLLRLLNVQTRPVRFSKPALIYNESKHPSNVCQQVPDVTQRFRLATPSRKFKFN